MDSAVGIFNLQRVLTVLNIHHGVGLFSVNPDLNGSANSSHVGGIAGGAQTENQGQNRAYKDCFAHGNVFFRCFHRKFLLQEVSGGVKDTKGALILLFVNHVFHPP